MAWGRSRHYSILDGIFKNKFDRLRLLDYRTPEGIEYGFSHVRIMRAGQVMLPSRPWIRPAWVTFTLT